MNYISVSSTGTFRGVPRRVNFQGPTFIDYYAESNTADLLGTQLTQMLMAESTQQTGYYPPESVGALDTDDIIGMGSLHGFSYNYKVQLPPLAVLEFLNQHGYKVVGTNTIGDTCIWTLHKQTV